VNYRDKHDFRGSDDLSCRANCSDYIVALFLMMQDHEGPVDRLFNSGSTHVPWRCISRCKFDEDNFGSTWVSDAPAQIL
jgi:hypothetical protein